MSKQNWYFTDFVYITLHKTAVANRYKTMICVLWWTNLQEIKIIFSPVSSKDLLANIALSHN